MFDRKAKKLTAQLRRGAIEYCVLALLREEDRYGFELTRALSAADGLVTSKGTVYPLLARLRQDRLVDTTWRESTQGPPRRYYQLTRDGAEQARLALAEISRIRDKRRATLSAAQPGTLGASL